MVEILNLLEIAEGNGHTMNTIELTIAILGPDALPERTLTGITWLERYRRRSNSLNSMLRSMNLLEARSLVVREPRVGKSFRWRIKQELGSGRL